MAEFLYLDDPNLLNLNFSVSLIDIQCFLLFNGKYFWMKDLYWLRLHTTDNIVCFPAFVVRVGRLKDDSGHKRSVVGFHWSSVKWFIISYNVPDDYIRIQLRLPRSKLAALIKIHAWTHRIYHVWRAPNKKEFSSCQQFILGCGTKVHRAA